MTRLRLPTLAEFEHTENKLIKKQALMIIDLERELIRSKDEIESLKSRGGAERTKASDFTVDM